MPKHFTWSRRGQQKLRRPDGEVRPLLVSRDAVLFPPPRDSLVRSRKRLLEAFTGLPSLLVDLLWRNERAAAEEIDRLRRLPRGRFFREARMCGPALLREEVDRYGYYVAAMNALRSLLPRSHHPRCAVFGLTAGAEVEAAYHAGYTVYLNVPAGPTRDLAEARLLVTRTPHENLDFHVPESLPRVHCALVTHRPFRDTVSQISRVLLPDGAVVLPRSLFGVHSALQEMYYEEISAPNPIVLALRRR